VRLPHRRAAAAECAHLYYLYVGISIIYYGTEQGFAGCHDPDNREVLWTTAYNTSTHLYQCVRVAVNARQQGKV